MKLDNLKDDIEDHMKDLETKVEHELNYAYDTHNTKLHNVWSDVLKIQSDLESIKLNLKK